MRPAHAESLVVCRSLSSVYFNRMGHPTLSHQTLTPVLSELEVQPTSYKLGARETMKQSCLELEEDLQGCDYIRLIELAQRSCDRFYLVWREQLSFGQSAEDCAVDLAPWLISEETTDTWDGTQLFGTTATLRHYKLCSASAQVLKKPGHLYAWLAPSLPEDLTFYTSGGALWMASVSHERGAGFDNRWVPADYLLHYIPAIKLRERPYPAGFLNRPTGQIPKE